MNIERLLLLLLSTVTNQGAILQRKKVLQVTEQQSSLETLGQVSQHLILETGADVGQVGQHSALWQIWNTYMHEKCKPKPMLDPSLCIRI